MNSQKKAYLIALGAVGLWSTIATASKLTLAHVTPAELLLYSSTISTVILFFILLFQKKLSVLRTFGVGDWSASLLFGAINPFGYYLVLFEAYRLLPAQQAQIINYTWAITLTVLSIPFLGQKVGKTMWLAIFTSYAGVLVIATKGEVFSLNFDNPKGVTLALLSTLLWAVYWLINTRDKRDPVAGLFANFLCSLPLVFGYLYLTEGVRTLPWRGYMGAAYIGCFEMGIAFVMWLTAMKLADNTAKIANLIFLSPVVSLFLIHYLVGEKIYVSTVMGFLLVLAGLFIQTLAKAGEASATGEIK